MLPLVHYRTAAAISTGPRTKIQDDSNVRRLPTVHFLQCSTTVPAIRGKTTTSAPYTRVRRPLLVTIKGGGGPPLRVSGLIWTRSSNWTLACWSLWFLSPKRTLSTTEHSSQPTPLLAETWELPSLSRLACITYYKHPGCKIIQCPRTPPLLDVRPRGRNQDKPCVIVIASCTIIWDEETRSIY